MENKGMGTKVSVVVPIYNSFDYVGRCIESFLSQTFPDLELILIDDGSTDQSGDLCEQYASSDKRVITIKQENKGVAAARNVGLRHASGEYIWFVDSDDWVEGGALEVLVGLADQYDVDCVMLSSRRYELNGEVVECPLFDGPFLAKTRQEVEEIQKYILYPRLSSHYTSRMSTGYIAPWSKFVRRSVLVSNDILFDGDVRGVFEDGLWTLHMLDYCSTILYSHAYLYNYRHVEDSLIHAFRPDAMEMRIKGFAKIEEWLSKEDKSSALWQAYYAYVVSQFGTHLEKYFFNSCHRTSVLVVRREMLSYLSRREYQNAFGSIDKRVLASSHRLLLIIEKKKSFLGLLIYHYLRMIKNRVKLKMNAQEGFLQR